MPLTAKEVIEVLDQYPEPDEDKVRAMLARVPPGWNLIAKEADGAAFRRGNICVIVSLAVYEDHNHWIHVSVSGAKSATVRFLPSWEDMKRVKHDFIGEDKWAYQVFPSQKQYVNLNPFVLHLYSLFENRPALPDFTRGTGQI
jgi:hypothetical protein